MGDPDIQATPTKPIPEPPQAKALAAVKLAPWWVWLLSAIAILGALTLFIVIIVWVPALLVEQRKADDNAYLKAVTDNRTALVQAVGGFGVFLGVVVGFFTLRHNRQLLHASRAEHLESLQESRHALEETLDFNRKSLLKTLEVTERGQITDRFSKAIEQLGEVGQDAADLRLGGIYALEQIAKDSTDWFMPVIEVLAAFVRQHSTGRPPPEGDTVESQYQALWLLSREERFHWLRVDLAAAVEVLSKRDRSKEPLRVNLRSADFRRVEFPVLLDLSYTDFAFARMQFSYLMYVDLRKCFFLGTQLQGADLEESDLRGAHFARTDLQAANFKNAKLEGAEFNRVDLSGVLDLTIDQLKVAKIDEETTLPGGIHRSDLVKQVAAETPPS